MAKSKTRFAGSSPSTLTKRTSKEGSHDVSSEMETDPPIQDICRTCLEEMQASNLIPLNDFSSNIRNELKVCIPEVDFDLVPNAGMCMYCLNALHSAYEFKQKCLQTEDKIRKQLHRKLLVDLTKLKKPNNIVQVSNGEGLGLDVVYINDPIEIIDGNFESTHFENPLASPPKTPTSNTPLLDEEIRMINFTSNHDDSSASPISLQDDVALNRYLCNDDDAMDDEIVVVSESNGPNKKQQVKSNVLLGLSESAPRKLPAEKKSATTASTPTLKTGKTSNETTSLTDGSTNVAEGLFECLNCKNTFEDCNVYMDHVKQYNTDKRVYKCNVCKFNSKTANGYATHLKFSKMCKIRIAAFKSKQISDKSVHKDVKQVEYKCQYCKFKTPVQLIYKKHLRICVNVKPQIKLKELKVKLGQKNLLQIKESRQVSPSVPLKLEDVNAMVSKKFGDINELVCRDCDFVSTESVQFESHVKTMHSHVQFPYSCKDPKCHFVARVKPGIIAHMTHHYGDRPFRCSVCTYQALSRKSLGAHIKRHVKKKQAKSKYKKSVTEK